MTDVYRLKSRNVRTLKISRTQQYREAAGTDRSFAEWKTMTSSHVGTIPMSTLLEGCVENTELHHKE